jgi:hypothetical protein
VITLIHIKGFYVFARAGHGHYCNVHTTGDLQLGNYVIFSSKHSYNYNTMCPFPLKKEKSAQKCWIKVRLPKKERFASLF